MGYPAYKCPNCGHHEMADPLALQKAFRGPYICKECNWDTRVPIPAGIVTTQQQKDQVQAEQMGEAISYTIKSMMDLIITLMNIFRWIIKNPIKSGFIILYQIPGYILLELDDKKTGNFLDLYLSYDAFLISSSFWLLPIAGFLFFQTFKFLRKSHESRKETIFAVISIFKTIIIRIFKIILITIIVIFCISLILHIYSLLDEQQALHIYEIYKYLLNFLKFLGYIFGEFFEILTLILAKVFNDSLTAWKLVLKGF